MLNLEMLSREVRVWGERMIYPRSLGSLPKRVPFGVLTDLDTIQESCSQPQFPPSVQFSSVQSLSRVRLFATPWIAARKASLSITNSQSLLKLMSIKLVMPSSHFTLCRPLLLLPQIPPSIRVFSNEAVLYIKWPKYWSFSFSISPSTEHPGLISFRMVWLDLLAAQGTLRSLLQYHSSKASIFWHSPYPTPEDPSIEWRLAQNRGPRAERAVLREQGKVDGRLELRQRGYGPHLTYNLKILAIPISKVAKW